MTASALPHDDAPTDTLALRRSEVAAIVAFWAFFAAITAASRLFDPRGPGPMSPVAIAFSKLAFLESAYWALVTPPIFLLASRYGADRKNRVLGVVLFLGVAVVAALAANLLTTWLRSELLPQGGMRGGGGGRRGGGGGRGLDRFAVINDVITALAIIAAGVARDASVRYRARKEQATRLAAETARLQAQLAEARLDALRRQLDPHFLFNTLNAVSSLVERDPRGVRRMIARLGDLLRHSIEGSGDPEVPLERELDLLQRYVDIMSVRFQGRLEVTIAADARARAAMVPNLILQPLVENAIQHGVAQVDGVGHVWVDAIARGDQLVLRVRDDGPGPGPTTESASGVGLRNTRERLEQLYGDRQRFTLLAGAEGGAVAELAIPYRAA